MDMTAITLCQENKMPIVVFDMNKPGNFLKVCAGDTEVGTTVH
jgi:uridylate kinase